MDYWCPPPNKVTLFPLRANSKSLQCSLPFPCRPHWYQSLHLHHSSSWKAPRNPANRVQVCTYRPSPACKPLCPASAPSSQEGILNSCQESCSLLQQKQHAFSMHIPHPVLPPENWDIYRWAPANAIFQQVASLCLKSTCLFFPVIKFKKTSTGTMMTWWQS